MADFERKSAIVDSPYGHARTPPLLDPRPGEDCPGRHSGRTTVALHPAALAHSASSGRALNLECPQLEPHRVVPVHLPAVLETQNLFQA